MNKRQKELEEKELLSVAEFQELQVLLRPFKWNCKCGVISDQPCIPAFGDRKDEKMCPVCFKKYCEGK